MSIANFEQLKDITQDLWRKAKAKIEAIANDYVSKTLPNNVVGETIFKDGYIEGGILSSFNNKNTQMYNAESGGCFGIPSTSISAGIRVGKIAIAVKDDLAVGSTVTNVVALAIRRSNNEVKESIIQNGTATVFQNQYSNINAQKIAYININKAFDEEVYFVIGCTNMLWNTDVPPHRANVYGSATIPAVGTVLDIQNYHYSGRMIVFSERMSFSEVINIKNDSVSKTKNNILTGKTILQDGYIDGELYSYNNPNATGIANGNSIYSGTNVRFIQSNQHVTSIVVAVNSAFEIGSKVSGVNVGVVRRDNNQVIEYIVQNGTGTVTENNYPQKITATRVVNITIDKKWSQDVYLIVGINGMLWGRVQGTPGVNIGTGGERLPNVGSTINNLNTSNYIGRVVVLGSNISLNSLTNKVDLSDVANEPNKIPRIGTDGRLPASILPPEQNGGVRTVNSQSPVNGNVTVYSDNIDISSSNSKKISQALDEKLNKSEVGNDANKIPRLSNGKLVNSVLPDGLINKNNVNNFTNKNDFNFYSPTVTRDFTIAAFNEVGSANRRYDVFNNNHYVVTIHNKFSETNKRVDSLIVPIANAQVGDTINASYFVINNNNVIIKAPEFQKPYTVEDIDMVGCKCIRIQVNQQFNQVVGFGFIVEPKTVRGNVRIGLAYATDNSYTNSVWSSVQTPHVNQSVKENKLPHKVFPYKVTHHTTSEVATRFELEKVTQMYPRNLIGEMKQLSYDAGNSLEDGTNTWLKANGQAINSNDYPVLYEKFNTSKTNDDIEVSIPSIDSQFGYYYICAK